MKAIQEISGIRIGIPRDYNGVINYNTLPSQDHYSDGWRDIVEPSYNSETQRKGAIYFDTPNDVFTYYVLDKTQEEINRYQEDLLNNDISARKRQKEVSDGLDMFEKFLVYIQRRFDKGTLTGTQAMSSFNLLYLPLLPLKDGMFRIVQSNLNALTNPTNANVLEVLNLAKQQVNNYITNNP